MSKHLCAAVLTFVCFSLLFLGWTLSRKPRGSLTDRTSGATVVEAASVTASRYRWALAQRDALSYRLNRAMRDYQRLVCLTKSKDPGVAKTVATGGWCNEAVESGHMTDLKLAHALRRVLANKSVASFGEGLGEYRKLLLNATKSFDAFDGAPFIEQKTDGVVRYLDLSVPQFGLPVYDWVMTIEVAEHIPREFESVFFDNLVRHSREGIILSWAEPGQGGFVHVNHRETEYVVTTMANLCFRFHDEMSHMLRNAASFWWLRNNLNVYVRDTRLDRCQVDENAA